METAKITGIILLIIGLLLIVVPLWHTYQILSGKSVPAPVFQRPESLKKDPNVSAFDVQGQMRNALISVIPIDFINNLLNLGTWLLLMWILIYGGGKIADIGVKLIK